MITTNINFTTTASGPNPASSSRKRRLRTTGPIKVSVFGLGYVGSVTSACLARKGHEVWGVDLDARKVDLINRGRTPLFEPGLEAIISECSSDGRIRATSESAEALLATDASIVCVGTPSLRDGSLDLGYVHAVANEIAEVLRANEKPHKLILRSTMLPGTTDMLVREYFLDLVKSKQLEVYYCPEFLREGTALEDFETPSLEVMGTVDGGEPASEEIRTLLGQSPQIVDWRSAELVKYACNFFHAVKVSFANEIGRLGDQMGIDSARVMDILCQDNRLNISRYYMRPGNPFGGSCLPKDVKALKSFARLQNISVPILENTFESNRAHQDHLMRKVEATGKRQVAILGIAFKPDTDDIRESPMIALAESLLGQGYSVKIFDPLLCGDPNSGLSRNFPHLAALQVDSLEESVEGECAIVAFRKIVPSTDMLAAVNESHHIVDVNGWVDLKQGNATYTGLCW